MDKRRLGSETAKSGFVHEDEICEKFRRFRDDLEAREWLNQMGCEPKLILEVEAHRIPPRFSQEAAASVGIQYENPAEFKESSRFQKADVRLRVAMQSGFSSYKNISLKKSKTEADYNQVDKRSIATYQEMWNFDEKVSEGLKLFSGEIPPKSPISPLGRPWKDAKRNNGVARRAFLDEIPPELQFAILTFFEKEKSLVIRDVLMGRGVLSANWFLVTRKNGNHVERILQDIDFVCGRVASGQVGLSPHKSLTIGALTMQRKGGDGGRPSANLLQFKMTPSVLF